MAAETVVVSSASSGLTVNVHPLPILNISDHHTRSRLTSDPTKLEFLLCFNLTAVFGALLGTHANRQLSVVNSFELSALPGSPEGVDAEFFSTRKEQFKQVFPSLDVVGWYTTGEDITANEICLHREISNLVDTPILILFSEKFTPGLPLKVYEAAADETADSLIELGYGVETGEAERIAVDGIMRGSNEDSALISTLATQRNAILMLYERITTLLSYVVAVNTNQALPDHTLVRQVSSVVAGLPTMDVEAFRAELESENSDVRLTSYLTTMVQQLGALNEYASKYNIVNPDTSNGAEFNSGRQGRGFGPMGRSRG